jgi:hypothetical protein
MENSKFIPFVVKVPKCSEVQGVEVTTYSYCGFVALYPNNMLKDCNLGELNLHFSRNLYQSITYASNGKNIKYTSKIYADTMNSINPKIILDNWTLIGFNASSSSHEGALERAKEVARELKMLDLKRKILKQATKQKTFNNYFYDTELDRNT